MGGEGVIKEEHENAGSSSTEVLKGTVFLRARVRMAEPRSALFTNKCVATFSSLAALH